MEQPGGDYKLGATFFPGLDDYYLPVEPADIISPKPQRITPEVPGQLQDSLQTLELDASESEIRKPSIPTSGSVEGITKTSPQSPQSPVVQDANRPFAAVLDEPNFSPFPKLRARPVNVPPTPEERESILENARVAVLASTDPEMQLSWAEDALAYADNCAGLRLHLAEIETPRTGTPSPESQIRNDATSVVNFLADQGHPKAEFIRGTWHEFGKFGFAQNKPEAFRAYKRAALKGYARAEYRMGLQYESTAEPMKALQHYKSGEALGDSASCYRVGMMSLLGQLGQTTDFATGIKLVRYSAETADENAPQGAYVFGMLCVAELPQVKIPASCLPVDTNLARTFIEKAAYLGFAKAQAKMGHAYETCSLGCTFDPALSLHYMNLAARQGETEAEMSISKWFLCGYETLFKRNNALAFEYANRAAVARLNTAEFALGYFHEVGIHVPVNLVSAQEWYQRAASNGNSDAKDRLDALSASKSLSSKDHESVALSRIRSQYGSQHIPAVQQTQIAQPTAPAQQTQGVQLAPVVEQFHSLQQSPNLSASQQTGSSVHPAPPQPSNHPVHYSGTSTFSNSAALRPATSVPEAQLVGRTTPYPLDDPPLQQPPYPINDSSFDDPRRPPRSSSFFIAPQRPYSVMSGNPPPQRTQQAGPQNSLDPRPGSHPHPNLHPLAQRPGAYRPLAQQGPKSVNPSLLERPGPVNAVVSSRPAIPIPRIDIGFSAPADPRADLRNRAPGVTQRPNVVNGDRRFNHDRTGTASVTTANTSDHKSNPNIRVTAAPNPASKSDAQATASASKSPKTFNEMGFTSEKRDHDCIVM